MRATGLRQNFNNAGDCPFQQLKMILDYETFQQSTSLKYVTVKLTEIHHTHILHLFEMK